MFCNLLVGSGKNRGGVSPVITLVRGKNEGIFVPVFAKIIAEVLIAPFPKSTVMSILISI